MVVACIGYVSSVKHINMDSMNLLVLISLIIAGIYMPFYMRDKRDKIKGITYKQLVVLCIIMVVCGIGSLILHFVGKR